MTNIAQLLQLIFALYSYWTPNPPTRFPKLARISPGFHVSKDPTAFTKPPRIRLVSQSRTRNLSLKIIEKMLGNSQPFLWYMYLKICLKAPQDYSASIRTYNFQICLWENPKTLIRMIPGLLDVSTTPQTNYFLSLETSRYLKQSKKIPNYFRIYYFYKYRMVNRFAV